MSSGSGERIDLPNPHAPVSLVNPRGATAASRRAIKGAVAANSSPTGDVGFKTLHRRYLHIVLKVVGGTAVDWRLWVRNDFSGEWGVDTRIGGLGTGIDTISTTDVDNPQNNILELVGSDRVYVELLNFAGGETVDVWLGVAGEEV